MTEVVLMTIEDDVAVLTLNRPDRLNAWTAEMQSAYFDLLDECASRQDVRVIVVTGAGRGFCAGADMRDTFGKRLEGADPGEDTEESGGMPRDVDWVALVRDSKPLIAAVNGAAVGIGMTMILPFDVILASARAKFGMLFIKVGLVPELASTRLLAQRIGIGRAGEMCLTGRLYHAEEAREIGLVDHVVEPDTLVDSALELGGEIAANPHPQLRMIKRLLTQNALEADLHVVQEREHALIRECWRSPEHERAVAAFLAKSS